MVTVTRIASAAPYEIVEVFLGQILDDRQRHVIEESRHRLVAMIDRELVALAHHVDAHAQYAAVFRVVQSHSVPQRFLRPQEVETRLRQNVLQKKR